MLSLDELKDIAKLKKLSLKNAEKDYLQDLVLFGIYSRIGKELIFKGGTCLCKIYGLNRFSEDLDFTLTHKIDINRLSANLIHDIGLIGIKTKVKETKEYKNEINIRLLFNGPLYNGGAESQCFIPLNISLKERVAIEPKKAPITSFYREIPTFEVFAMAENEIFAEKVRAILTRDKARDVYDLWFLTMKKQLAFDVPLINKKLKLYKMQFNKEKFIAAMDKKKSSWELDLKNLILHELPGLDSVKNDILARL